MHVVMSCYDWLWTVCYTLLHSIMLDYAMVWYSHCTALHQTMLTFKNFYTCNHQPSLFWVLLAFFYQLVGTQSITSFLCLRPVSYFVHGIKSLCVLKLQVFQMRFLANQSNENISWATALSLSLSDGVFPLESRPSVFRRIWGTLTALGDFYKIDSLDFKLLRPAVSLCQSLLLQTHYNTIRLLT